MPVNRDNCRLAFQDAMRERLDLLDPAQGDNVEHEDVMPNLDALGHAVLDILTINAEVLSNNALLPPQLFWTWISEVQAYMQAIAAWRAQLQTALTGWDETLPPPMALAALKASLAGVAPPATAPPPLEPSEIVGIIR